MLRPFKEKVSENQWPFAITDSAELDILLKILLGY